MQSTGLEAAYIAKQKLSQDWTADRFVPQVKAEILQPLLQDVERLQSDVQARLVLACVLGVGKQSRDIGRLPEGREELTIVLNELVVVLGKSDDEWVRAMAAAAGPFDGRLHLSDMEAASKAVRTSPTHENMW